MEKTMSPAYDILSTDIGRPLPGVFLISLVPDLAKLIVGKVDDLSGYRYSQQYADLWNRTLPEACLATIEKYAGSELEKVFRIQMFRTVTRITSGQAEPGAAKSLALGLTIGECVDNLETGHFNLFLDRLYPLTQPQCQKILESPLPSDQAIRLMLVVFQKEGKLPKINYEEIALSCEPVRLMPVYYLETILRFDDGAFKNWADGILEKV